MLYEQLRGTDGYNTHQSFEAKLHAMQVIEIPKGSKVKYELDKETGDCTIRPTEISSASSLSPAQHIVAY